MAVARGAYHVHSVGSDGTGSMAEIAAAAARAGLEFVIVTDHGDGTRPARPPHYDSGVLCIDAVEISADEGHYAALGLPRAPYPLGGEARDVVEDVTRLGGFGIVTHPDSAKFDMSWREWDAAFPGIEWFNADSQWRDEPRWHLPPALFHYLFRPTETVAALFDRPDAVMARWDALAQRRRIVGLAGHDAHQRLGLRGGVEPGDERWYLKVPRYEDMFQSFSLRVELATPFSRQARADADALIAGIKAGHVYTVIDAVAGPAAFSFEGRVGDEIVRMGDAVPLHGPIQLAARSNAPAGASLRLLRNGRVVLEQRGSALDWTGHLPGAYRIEVYVPDSPGHPPVPWIVTNPVYVGLVHQPAGPPGLAPASAVHVWPHVSWTVEKSLLSKVVTTVAIDPSPPGVVLRYRLGPATSESPYVAITTHDVNALREAGRVAFRAVANRPMRASVQVRIKSSDPDARWRRTFYVDRIPREIIVPLADLRPVRPDHLPALNPASIEALLFVIDTRHTVPGTGGTLTIDRLRTER
jgi:hypothetical protein